MNNTNQKIKLNYQALDALLQFKTSKKFCAYHLGISEDTLERRLREDHDMTFTEYKALQMENTSIKLQSKAIAMGLDGDQRLLMFSLKNISGWTEKAETKTEVVGRIEIDEADKAV